MNKIIIENSEDNNKLLTDEYYSGEELSEAETNKLAHSVEGKIEDYKLAWKFIKHLRALKDYMTDKNVKWYKKSIVVAALIYFVTPLDAVPDFIPFAGFLDDIGVIAWTIKFLGKELEGYY